MPRKEDSDLKPRALRNRARNNEELFEASDTKGKTISKMMKREKGVYAEAAKDACILHKDRLDVEDTLQVRSYSYVFFGTKNEALAIKFRIKCITT